MSAPGEVELIDLRKEDTGGSEDEGGRWVTYCVRHGAFVQHETRKLARGWLPYPEEWCVSCQKEREENK